MGRSKRPRTLRASIAQTTGGSALAFACACGMVSYAGAADTSATSEEKKTLAPVLVEADPIQKAEANPHANPNAPYKIETLASPKYTRPIAKTPKSISVIGKEQIEDSGANDLADVMRAQPGVTISTGEGGNAFGDRFIIRGFEARNDVFVDGLRDPGVNSRDIFAVEQVEISKGPSSSFAGRGTTGGAINNVTKKPGKENFTKVTTSLGTDSKQRYTIDNNIVITDELALRTNLLYSDRDVPDRGLAEEQRQGAAFALQWDPTDDLKLNLDYYYHASDDMPDGGVPWDQITNAPVPGRKYYGQNGRDYQKTQSDILTLGLKYTFNEEISLQNLSRYGITTNEYLITIPGLTTATATRGDGIARGVSTPGVYVRASSQSRNQKNTYLGNQTNVTYDTEIAGQRHTFLVGTEISHEESTNLPFSDSLRSPNAGDPLAPNNDAWLEGGGSYSFNENGYGKIKINTLSAYGSDTWTITDDWELFGGLRYDTFDYTVNSGATAYTGSTAGEISSDEGFVNGHAGVVFSPWKNGNVYFSYATSSNPTGEQLDAFTNCAYGGFCQDGTTGATPKPEQNQSFELGTKWELMEKQLLLTGALFQITKENVISSAGGRGVPLTFTQVGEMRVRGVEMGLSGNVTEKLSGAVGVVIMDTEITKSDNPAEIGSSFPNTAENSATAQLKYKLTEKAKLGGVVTYTGEIEGGTPNGSTTGNTIDANTRLDLNAEYDLTQNASIRLNILNVTDEEYYDALYRSGAPFVYVGEGRSAFVTLAYEF